MPGLPPDGAPAPADGALPEHALSALSKAPFAIYLHVPFCAARCGYCDFNTYVLSAFGPDALTAYLSAVRRELDLAARVLGKVPKVTTVYFGGGTPSMLPVGEQAALLDAIRQRFPLAKNAEITTEANPESVSPMGLDMLAMAGFNRISFGMQSAVPKTLATLERNHTVGRVFEAVEWARKAGFRSVSLDLIYGTPGEAESDWRASVETALSMKPDHISAYSLTVEPGTRLAGRVASGELDAPDEDTLADYYTLADGLFDSVGLHPYEISNWARRGHQAKHNLVYWHSGNWWGIGPGAHSHVGGVRWWNLRHPRDYAQALEAGRSPAQAREELTPEQTHLERVMLGLRLAEGLAMGELTPAERKRVPELKKHGFAVVDADRLRLTLSGRLLADAIARDLVSV
ncbi:MAG: radical SAM family heme chaperone HemW [Propionibacteriaceae bacterium]|jgi:oxygen-independent coproporphyrinogen-3 oxidase|nr:radical SAM family heme chaperone HemW [Propionibacteriaceae bacterium]